MRFARLAHCISLPAAAIAGVPGALHAQTTDSDTAVAVSTDDSRNPGPIGTDRPTKSNAACTVPEGMVQVEADLFSWTRMAHGSARADVLVYSNPVVKYGLGAKADIQLNIAPLVEVRTRAVGQAVSQSGVGDLTLRFKQRLTGSDSRVQVALLPFVKAPTAERGIGNGEWEGGVIVPVQVPVGHGHADAGAADQSACRCARAGGSSLRVSGGGQSCLPGRRSHNGCGGIVDLAELGPGRDGAAVLG